MVTIHDVINRVIDESNVELAGKVVDVLRFKCGMDYNAIVALVQKVRPEVTEAQWEALMYEADVAGGS